MMTITTIATDHVDLLSTRDFAVTVQHLEAELGLASTAELMDRLVDACDWADYAGQCAALAGHSGLIQVGHLNWGDVLTLSGMEMKARCFIVGNPVTAQKLLSAGGPEVGMYLPAKILIFEAADGTVHVAYDRLSPTLRRFEEDDLDKIASVIDGVLEKLARSAAGLGERNERI